MCYASRQAVPFRINSLSEKLYSYIKINPAKGIYIINSKT